jgi:hypothetical protein
VSVSLSFAFIILCIALVSLLVFVHVLITSVCHLKE